MSETTPSEWAMERARKLVPAGGSVPSVLVFGFAEIIDRARNEMLADIESLQAENARFRAALVEIEDACSAEQSSNAKHAAQVARNALDPTPEPEDLTPSW